jgi:hypothetical protein
MPAYKRNVTIIDGLGGGIGAELVSRMKGLPANGVEIIALGTNSTCTERMLKAGATRVACGENAVCVCVPHATIIAGPIGIIIANSMMGEVTPRMATAVLGAPCERILIPLANEHCTLAGFEGMPLSKMLDRAAVLVQERLELLVESC